VDHIDFAYYYLLCALATARLKEASRHGLSELSEKLILESYKYFISAQAFRVEVDAEFEPPIVKYNTEYVYLIMLDAERVSSLKSLGQYNACCRIYQNLLSLHSVPFWNTWVRDMMVWTKIQTACTLAVFINEQYDLTDPLRKASPDKFARICVETVSLLSYTGTNVDLLEHAKRSLTAGYSNNTENCTPAYLRDILNGTFFEKRKPPPDIVVEATLDEMVPYTPMF
jgi:hypothetical protein